MDENRYFAPDTEDFKKLPGYPDMERMKKGPVAVIECNQNIPCNPCESMCLRKAITVGKPITNLPVLNEDECIGCGLCVAACPGQAIFMIDMSLSGGEALVAFPYEYVPVPEVGSEWTVVDRNGKALGTGVIHKVQSPESFDHTNVVWVKVASDIAEEVRSVERKK